MKQIGLIVFVMALIGAGIAYYDINYVRANVETQQIETTTEMTDIVVEETKTTDLHDPHAGHNHAAPTASGVVPTTVHEYVALSAKPDNLKEYALGDKDAPVTIVEFASYSCGHCGQFHMQNFDAVKKDLIDTGKARFIYRDFPLNAPALTASKIAHCVDQSRYVGMVDTIFKTQDRWLASQDMTQSLTQMARLAGMSKEAIDACLTDEALETSILKQYQSGRDNFQVQSTPTFVFFGTDNRIESFSGNRNVATFTDVVEKLSK